MALIGGWERSRIEVKRRKGDWTRHTCFFFFFFFFSFIWKVEARGSFSITFLRLGLDPEIARVPDLEEQVLVKIQENGKQGDLALDDIMVGVLLPP